MTPSLVKSDLPKSLENLISPKGPPSVLLALYKVRSKRILNPDDKSKLVKRFGENII